MIIKNDSFCDKISSYNSVSTNNKLKSKRDYLILEVSLQQNALKILPKDKKLIFKYYIDIA